MARKSPILTCGRSVHAALGKLVFVTEFSVGFPSVVSLSVSSYTFPLGQLEDVLAGAFWKLKSAPLPSCSG